MSIQKEKKIKRLKKQRMWPYVFGIFMVIAVFAMLAVLVMTIRFISLAYDKLQQGYDNSQSIIQVIEENWDETNPDSMKEICNFVMKTMPHVQDVCIADSANEVIWSSGVDVPDWECYLPMLSTSDVKFILDYDENSFFYVHEDEINFKFENVINLIRNKLLNNEEEVTSENLWESETLTMLSFWYEMPLSNGRYNVCVKNSMPVKMTELFFMAAVVDIIIALALILIVYYLISIFSLLFERRKLAKILDTDVVTGGFNLQYFNKMGNKLLKKNRRGKYNYAVVAIRMEKYHNFCSCYGVKEGEELLENFSCVLQKGLSKREVIAYGGKAEFALLLIYNTEEELLHRVSEMISRMDDVKSEQKKYFSVGIYKVLDAKGGIEAMYNCAGVARNKVTEDSENRIIWFNDEMDKEQFWVQTVENDMERAIANKEFQVYLQPKYSTKEEVLSGAEALVRWIHPKEGFVPPYRFIPIFENNGFVIHLDDYMLTEVARQQAKWIAEGKKVVPVSVNISRVHFVREDLAEHICRIVDQFQVPHDVIELELTESAFFDDKSVLLNTIRKLKSYGFAISMDDFGSGYSSLNSLKELPLDVVKLDAGFFREEDEAGRGKLIVEDTISLAKKLQMKIVAEGIETREQVDFLASLNCDLIQGYYFAKPMPVSEFEERAFAENEGEKYGD